MARETLASTAAAARESQLLLGSCHVLDASGHVDPGVHALLVDRERWGGKLRIGECANGYCHELWMTFEGIVDGGTAAGAESERGSCAFVSDADVLDALADEGDCFAREASLSTEDAAGAALAR
jgi:hypothetical protein